MPGVFISYRRDDSAGYAGALLRELNERIGPDQVFMDTEDIEAGVEFPAVLRQAVQTCDVLLALIGSRWLDARDAQGRRRLDDPSDFVRQEIALALQSGARVIPVLLDGTPMPSADELPEALKPLADRNALAMSNGRWAEDVARLMDQVKEGLYARGVELAASARAPADFVASVPMHPATKWLIAAAWGFAAVFGGVAAALAISETRFEARSARAEADVVRLVEKADADDRSKVYYHPELAFLTPNGEQVSFVASVGSDPPSHRVGERVPILYDPADPRRPSIDSFGQRWLLPMVFGFFGVLGGLAGFAPIAWRGWRARRIRSLFAKGKPIVTAFHAVEQDMSVTVNGRHPYRVLTEWRHPVSKELVHFRSQPIWDDPTAQARARMITVLIDPDNFRRYVVDLSFLKGRAKATPRDL